MGSGQSYSKPKVYYDPLSINSMRVLIYLKEANIEADLVKLQLLKGEHKTEEYSKLNPRQQVPLLEVKYNDNTIRVAESVAIIEFLGRIFPNEKLFPIEPENCAINCMRIAEFHQKLDPKNFLGSVIFQNKTREMIGEDRIQGVFKELDVWEGYLSQENQYFVGDEISTSDIIVFPAMFSFFYYLGLSEDDFPFLAAWYRRMKERPSIKDLEIWNGFEQKSSWKILKSKKPKI